MFQKTMTMPEQIAQRYVLVCEGSWTFYCEKLPSDHIIRLMCWDHGFQDVLEITQDLE